MRRTGTTGSAWPCPANHGNDLETSDIIEPILERSGMYVESVTTPASRRSDLSAVK